MIRVNCRRALTVVGVLVSGGLACSNPSMVPDTGIHPAIIELHGVSRIEVPRTATVGERVEVLIGSWAGETLAKQIARTEIAVDGLRVLIQPQDSFSWKGPVLSRDMLLERRVGFIIDVTGRARIEIRGRSAPGYREISKVYWLDVRP